MTYLLRHGAAKEGLKLRSDGYARVDDFLALPESRKKRLTLELIRTIVDSNDKKRFTLTQENGAWLIRANQGHSDSSITQLELTPIISLDQLPAGTAIHGTYFEAWKTIRKEGLSKMSRNHIHFAIGEIGAEGVISGMRSSAQVLVYLNVKKALEDGIPLFLSSNSVVLSPGVGPQGAISPKYFLAVVRANDKTAFDPDFTAAAPKVWKPAATQSAINDADFPSL